MSVEGQRMWCFPGTHRWDSGRVEIWTLTANYVCTKCGKIKRRNLRP